MSKSKKKIVKNNETKISCIRYVVPTHKCNIIPDSFYIISKLKYNKLNWNIVKYIVINY